MTGVSLDSRTIPAKASKDEWPTLLVFADDWGRHPSSCQHLIQAFDQTVSGGLGQYDRNANA